MIAQSIRFIHADGAWPHDETDPLLPASHPVYGETGQGVRSLERQVVEAPLDGIVQRCGPGIGFAQPIAPGSVPVDAAAKAAELAVTKGQRGMYKVTETDGTTSSEKAIRAFGWDAGRRCAVEAPWCDTPTRPAMISDLQVSRAFRIWVLRGITALPQGELGSSRIWIVVDGSGSSEGVHEGKTRTTYFLLHSSEVIVLLSRFGQTTVGMV